MCLSGFVLCVIEIVRTVFDIYSTVCIQFLLAGLIRGVQPS